MTEWLQTPPGQSLLDWQQQAVDRCVSDLFGYHAVQLGGLTLPALQANRMPNRWAIQDAGACWQEGAWSEPGLQGENGFPQPLPVSAPAALMTDARALPFAEASLDLVVLPHTLEFNPDPHASLREVSRVLVNEGHVVVLGINPLSLWGFKQLRGHFWRRLGMGTLFLPEQGEFLPPWRVADWLRLLGFVVTSVEYGCYQSAARRSNCPPCQAWLNSLGARLWPMLGAAYCMTAVKRTESPMWMAKPWKVLPVVRQARPVAAAAPQSGALRDPEA